MNNVFRLVWDRSLGRLVVVSEAARARSKSSVHGHCFTSGVVHAGSLARRLIWAPLAFAVAVGSYSTTLQAQSYQAGGGNAASCPGGTWVFYGNPGVSGFYNDGDTDCAIAIGDDAQAIADSGNSHGLIAIGAGSTVESTGIWGAVALGTNAYAINSGVAIGAHAISSGGSTIAMGRQSAASGIYSIALGRVSYAQGPGSMALGVNANAQGARAIAIGGRSDSGSYDAATETRANGIDAIAIGGGASRGSRAEADRAIAIGQAVNAEGDTSVAMGFRAETLNQYGIALGANSSVEADFSMALGNQANASGDFAGAVGYQSNAGGERASAYGYSANASAPDSVALGDSTASGDRSLAGGVDASAISDSAVALGDGAQASGTNAIAMGAGAVASAENSISIGTGNQVSGVSSGVVGDPNIITGDGSYALGNDNTIAAAEAGAFGNDNVLAATATGSRVVGSNSNIDVPDAFVLGNNADVTVAGGVALGNGAIANTGAGIQGYNPTTGTADGLDAAIAATESTTGAVAVGDAEGGGFRQITGVAAGTEDSDAVNVAQLKASETHYYSVNDDGVFGGNYSNDGAAGANSLAAGVDALAGADGTTALGFGANASATDSVAMGSGSVADGSTLGSAAYQPQDANGNPIAVAAPTATSEVSVGSAGSERRVTNVAAGAEDTDAVNVSQLRAVNDVANTGWHLSAQDTAAQNVAPDDEVNLRNSDGNLVITQATDNNREEVTFNLDDDVVVNNSVSVGSIVTDATSNDITGLSNTDLDDPSFGTLGRAATEEQLAISVAASRTEVEAGTNVTSVDQTTGTDGQDIYTVNADDASVSAGSGAVEVTAAAPDADNVTDYAVDLSQASKERLTLAGSALQTVVTQIDGTEVKTLDQDDNVANFISGDNIELSDDNGAIEVATAQDVTFTTITSDSLSITDGPTLSSGGIDMNTTTISNLADGVEAQDAVNLSQLEGAAAASRAEVEAGSNITVTDSTGEEGQAIYTVATADKVSFDQVDVGSVSIAADDVDDAGDTIISGVGSGDISENSNDAINGSQLWETQNLIRNLEGDITNITGDTGDEFVSNNGLGIRYVRTNDNSLERSDAFAQGEGSTAVGYEAVASAGRALAMGYDAVASHQGSVALGEGARTAEAVGTASIEIAGQTYQFAGASPVATVSVGSVGNERTITNVAAGRITADSTDAINGSQLYAAMDFMGSLDDRLTIVEGDTGGGGTDGAVMYDRDDNGDINYDSVTLEGEDGTKLTNVADGDISNDSSDAINGSQLHETNQDVANNTSNIADNSQRITNNEGNIADNSQRISTNENSITDINDTLELGLNFGADEGDTVNRQLGDTVAITGDENITTKTTDDGVQVTMNRDLDVDSVTTGNTTVNNEGVSIKDGPSMTVDGIDAGGTTITNVAPGVNESDAVNVGQMNELGRRFQNEITNVHGRIDSVERNANAGSASAIAASTVPQAWMPGKSMVGVGAGTYGGESAVSVGVSRLSDNGRWVIQGKVTGDSQSNFGAGIGAGWHW